jgi:hypothetical protein
MANGLQAAIARASAQVATLRNTAERERARLNDQKLEDLGMTAQAERERRPDVGKGARQESIRVQTRICIANDNLLVDAERALKSLIAKAHQQPKRNGSRRNGKRTSR